MNRTPTIGARIVAAAMLLSVGALLSGCGAGSSFDPSDFLDFLDTKKKLPGDRRPVFPEGVPGIEKGVPQDLYKGAQQQDVPPPAVAEPPPEPASKKGRSKSAARSAPQAAAPEADAPQANEGAAAETPAAPKMKQKRTRATSIPQDEAPPPARQPAAQPAQQSGAFPAPLPSGGFSR